MLLDFGPLDRKETTLQQLVATFSTTELAAATNALYDLLESLLAACADADVVFQPVDAAANDPYAAADSERGLAWTLGHVIVHLTASCEESAFLAAEMARGIPNHGRSRWETPWESVTTVAQCRQRLAESRRMLLASLQIWPDQPQLAAEAPWPGAAPVDARGRFALGLWHADSHLAQLRDILAQAHA
jgi:hypothetical protein